ncbi:prepilin peptidase [Paenibacillus protaetiae]|uniref:Prepilin peptidase n=1 Tax=Paenibacillus protaetiae TaxID=2509456 RepID=A0A4V0YF45_9BACL|nr:A24 family peptidase [Paenibacillus protaetiae]QAY66431.1 prepilin peptidase [Paenibacillus protaetiae]
MPAAAITLFAAAGLLAGGALNAVALRWDPRLTAAYPPVYCPDGHRSGGGTLRWLPLLPAAANGCRCRTCGRRLPWRYPLAEAGCALLYALAAAINGSHAELFAALLLISVLLIIVQTDLSAMTIPNRVVAAGIIAAALLRLFAHPLPLANYGMAALAGSGFLLGIGWIGGLITGKETVGGGDIKLYLFLGLVLGIKLTLLSLFLAALSGLAAGLTARMLGRQEAGRAIPFGPYIALGALLAYWWGDSWISGYLVLAGL